MSCVKHQSVNSVLQINNNCFSFRKIQIMPWECPHCAYYDCVVKADDGVVICCNCSEPSPLTSSLESVSVRLVENSQGKNIQEKDKI